MKKTEKVFRLICILIFIISIFGIAFIFYQSYLSDKSKEYIEAAYTDVSDTGKADDSRENQFKMSNQDCIGWLTIENTNIDYPVVQGSDNSYYLKHDINKKYNYYGNLFMDYRDDENTFNTVIYGHNMLDSKMFGKLINYYSNKDKGLQHSDLIFADKNYTLAGAFYCKDTYDFAYPIKTISDVSNYIENINKIMTYSLQKINPDDKLLLLATCSYRNKNQRFIVVFKAEGGI